MFYRNRKTYAGRMLVRILEAGLIFGIVFFGLDALANLSGVQQQDIVIENEPTRYEVVVPQRDTLTSTDYFYLALDQQMSDNYFEAIGYYNRALRVDPNHAASLLNRGVAYEQSNQPERAMIDYNTFMNREGTQHINASIHFDEYNVEVPMAVNRVYEFTFYAEAGSVLDVAAIGAEGFGPEAVDPLLVLVGPDGEVVAGDDDTLRQDGSLVNVFPTLEEVELDTTGHYVLRLSHAGGQKYGTVNLDFNVSESAFAAYSFDYTGCNEDK